MQKTTNNFDHLGQVMIDNYIAVNKAKNPFAKAVDGLSKTELAYVIGQYTLFPANIVAFLNSARNIARKAGWTKVDKELTRNMGEELGTETDGMTHYEMLITGVGEESGLITKSELEQVKASPSTEHFIETMRRIVGNENTAYAMGGTYALECSAVPELVIVKMLVDKLFVLTTGKPIQPGRLYEFFKMHLSTWEPGHEEGLRNTSAHYLKEGDEQKFEQGFKDVMTAMDIWWTKLFAEKSK